MISASFSLSGYTPVANEILIISFSGKQRIGARSFRTSVGILLGPDAFEFTNEEIILIISPVSALRNKKLESTRSDRYFVKLVLLECILS